MKSPNEAGFPRHNVYAPHDGPSHRGARTMSGRRHPHAPEVHDAGALHGSVGKPRELTPPASQVLHPHPGTDGPFARGGRKPAAVNKGARKTPRLDTRSGASQARAY